MHLNFGTCAHIDRRLTPTSRFLGRHLRTKGLGKSGGPQRILHSVYELGAVRPRLVPLQERCSSPNWHLFLPLLAEPASVPCSTVQLIGIT
jgi:hypothetical protein